MATFAFSVGRKGEDSVQLTASIPALSEHPLDKPIPFQIKLPDGRIVKGETSCKTDLMLGNLAIELQHATRDLVFPVAPVSGNGKRRKAVYSE